VKQCQRGDELVANGVVGRHTWQALPDGGPMPQLDNGCIGNVVRGLRPLRWCTTFPLVDGVARP
jgi:hypothetical protein